MPGHTHATFRRNILQHCWIVLCDVVKELAKRAQHLATSKNVATKLWPFLNLIQYHPRCMLQHFATGWPNAWNASCAIMLQNIVCVWPGIWNVFNKDFLTSVYSWRNLNRKLNHLIKLFAKPACAKIFTGGINILNDQAGGQDCRLLAEFFFRVFIDRTEVAFHRDAKKKHTHKKLLSRHLSRKSLWMK